MSTASMTLVQRLLKEQSLKKYQNGKLETRMDVKRPYYFVRVTVVHRGTNRKSRERKILGFMDEINRKEAMKRRAEILELVNADRLVVHAQIHFWQLIERFKEARFPQFGTGTAARYESQLATHILPFFGSMKLMDIERPMVEAWLVEKGKDGLSWWTREGLRSALASIFATAKDWGWWTGDNPAAGIRLGRKVEARKKVLLTGEQLQHILAGVKPDTRLIILSGVLLGLRISEIVGLQWGDFDFAKGTVTINRRWYRGDVDLPKTAGSVRTLQLGPLAGEFAARSRQHQYVFADHAGVPLDERDILRYELRPLLRRLGIYQPGMGWHAFRRANVTLRQTIGGAEPLEAMRAAGHTRVDTTFLYSLGDPEREREQVNRMFERLIGKTEGA